MKSTNSLRSLETGIRPFTDLPPRRLPDSRQALVADMKADLEKRLSLEFPGIHSLYIRQAVVEADALASLTTVPYLLLPTLAEEKVLSLSKWMAHQRVITGNTELAFPI